MRFLSFSRKNGLNSAKTIWKILGWLMMWMPLIRIGTESCSQSTMRLANCGVNCQVCCSDKPSISNITTAPCTCVSGSSVAASKNITQPLNTSSNVTCLCFQRSTNRQKGAFNWFEWNFDWKFPLEMEWVNLLPSSNSNMRRPNWSRFGNTTKIFCLKMFDSFDGVKSS